MDDSTLFEVCDRKCVSVIQESVDNAARWTVDIAARWTVQNDMKINSGKSKDDHQLYTRWEFFHDLTWNKHVENIVEKTGKRLYMLYQLKRAGISQSDLVTVCVSFVRPVLEYACPVWCTNLQNYLFDNDTEKGPFLTKAMKIYSMI